MSSEGVLQTVCVGGCLGFLALLAVLHGVRPDVSIVSGTVSEYGRGRHNALFMVALAFFAMAKATAAWLIWSRMETTPLRIASALLLVDAVATIAVALAPTDAGGTVTAAGRVHNASAAIAFTAGALAALVVSIWLGAGSWAAGLLRLIGILAFASVAGFGLATLLGTPLGIVERLAVTAIALWLAAVALWSHSMGTV